MPDALPVPGVSGGLTSSVADAGVPVTEGDVLEADLPAQEPVITAGAPAIAERPEIPDPELTRMGIPRPAGNPLAESFGEIRWDSIVPETGRVLVEENRRQMEIRRDLSTPEMKETFRLVLDRGMPLMEGDMNSYEDVEKENTSRIVDKFLKDMTGGPVPYGVNDLMRKLLVQEAALRFFDGRGAESEVALKGEIVEAALAERERDDMEQRHFTSVFSEVLGPMLGTGPHAQILSGHQPSIVRKVKGSLNEIGDVRGSLAAALCKTGGNVRMAIELERNKASRLRETSDNPALSNSFGGYPVMVKSLHDGAADEAAENVRQLEKIQALFDSAGIPSAERRNYILDTVRATAWTMNEGDNIRQGSKRQIFINPGQIFGNPAGLIAEINTTDSSPDEKHDAISRLHSMRMEMAGVIANDTYYADSGYAGFERLHEESGITDKLAILDEWGRLQQERGWLWMVMDGAKTGAVTHSTGFYKTAAGVSAAAGALVGADEFAGKMAGEQVMAGDAIREFKKAAELRGVTGIYADVSDGVGMAVDVLQMVVGGELAAPVKGLAGAVARGMAMGALPAAQCYEAKTYEILNDVRERKGGPLTQEEIVSTLRDPKTQASGFLSAFQGVLISRMLPGGRQVSAVGPAMGGMTVRQFIGQGGRKELLDPAVRRNLGQMAKNVFGGLSDEVIETFLNNATDQIAGAFLAGKDVRLGDVLEGAFENTLGTALLPTHLRSSELNDRPHRMIPDHENPHGSDMTAKSIQGDAISSPASPDGSFYSVVFEMKLDPSDYGKSEKVHFNRANKAVHEALLADAELAARMESLIPGITQSVSSAGGRDKPEGFTWHHHASPRVMQLVPSEQHTAGSIFWRSLHPDRGAAGGYSIWAIPAGAPKR